MKMIFLEFIQIVRKKFLRYRLYPGTELLFNLYTFLSFKSLKIIQFFKNKNLYQYFW